MSTGVETIRIHGGQEHLRATVCADRRFQVVSTDPPSGARRYPQGTVEFIDDPILGSPMDLLRGPREHDAVPVRHAFSHCLAHGGI